MHAHTDIHKIIDALKLTHTRKLNTSIIVCTYSGKNVNLCVRCCIHTFLKILPSSPAQIFWSQYLLDFSSLKHHLRFCYSHF